MMSLRTTVALSLIAAALATTVPPVLAQETPPAAAPAARTRTLRHIRVEMEAAARAYDGRALALLDAELLARGGDATDRETTTLRLAVMFHEASILRYRRKVQDHPDSAEFKVRQLALAEDGEELATKLLEQSPDDVRLLALAGELTAARISGPNGAFIGPRAATHIERALELEPNDVDAHLAAGRRYLYTPGAFGGSDQTALEHLEKAQQIVNDRERELLKHRRAKLDTEERDKTKRKSRLREIVKQTRAEVWYMHEEVLIQLAVVYDRMGRESRARIALKRALASNPGDEQATLLLRRIDARRQSRSAGR